ncbi:MAG: ATP-binding cassette domain-containing protein [Streptosporangiales bacterium]|nr:ATP-binding cassette domain-containing protein [Streptosporangiales bacterium]
MPLHANDLALAYGRDPVIADLTVHIPQGQVTALVGANASGKSTLLRGLGRLLRPAHGAVYLDGRAITQMSTKDIARRMAILPQGPDLPEGVTVRQLAAHGRYPHQGMLQQWSHRDEQAVADALAATGTTALADRMLDELSGGQRQRAWIAMTLAQEAEIMLLDEPTTFLDIAHQVDILDLLHELNERDGRTIVMALHDLNQAARYSHRILAIRRGRLAAEGPPHHVITEHVVRDIFDLDVSIIQDPTTGAPLCIPISPRAARQHHRPATSTPPGGRSPNAVRQDDGSV